MNKCVRATALEYFTKYATQADRAIHDRCGFKY